MRHRLLSVLMLCLLSASAESQTLTFTNQASIPIYTTITVPSLVVQYSYQNPNAAPTTTNVAAPIPSSVIGPVNTDSTLKSVTPSLGGSIAGLTVAALTGLFGYLKSSKSSTTSSTLSQEVETVLEFVKMLPNGATYNTALQNFMQKHQAETGVLTDVVKIIRDKTSNQVAKAAADNVMTAVNTVQEQTAPATVTPVVTAEVDLGCPTRGNSP